MKLLVVAPPYVSLRDVDNAVFASGYRFDEVVIGDHNEPAEAWAEQAWAEHYSFPVCHMNSHGTDLETLAKRMVDYADAAVIVCDCDDELVHAVHSAAIDVDMVYFLTHAFTV